MRRLLFLFPALLGACSTMAQAPLPPGSDGGSGMCDNSGLAAFVGQLASAELGGKMLAQSGARTLRWVAHGSMITMEFSPERLTTDRPVRRGEAAYRAHHPAF